MYNNDYNYKQSSKLIKEKKENSNVFSTNYGFSLAIEKCNRRLEKLKNEKNLLMTINSQYPCIDPRNLMFPMRQPVCPNPMMYAYQFIPPKIYETAKMPQMSQPFPQSLDNIQIGMKLPQNNINTTETGFNYSDLSFLVNSLKGFKPDI